MIYLSKVKKSLEITTAIIFSIWVKNKIKNVHIFFFLLLVASCRSANSHNYMIMEVYRISHLVGLKSDNKQKRQKCKPR